MASTVVYSTQDVTVSATPKQTAEFKGMRQLRFSKSQVVGLHPHSISLPEPKDAMTYVCMNSIFP